MFLTPTALAGFWLGRYRRCLASAAFIYLGRASLLKPPSRGNLVLMTLVLWALTARPQLAITAGVALLAIRQWRTRAAGIFADGGDDRSGDASAGTTLVLGLPIIARPLRSGDRTPAYQWALVPSYMNNLRAVLTMACGVRDDWSCKISMAAWLVSLALVLMSAWHRRLPTALVWGTCILLQLLLCPHVNSYELILLYAVMVCVLHLGGDGRLMFVPLAQMKTVALHRQRRCRTSSRFPRRDMDYLETLVDRPICGQ